MRKIVIKIYNKKKRQKWKDERSHANQPNRK